jgi:DNA-binding MarR family transcriptional regulator
MRVREVHVTEAGREAFRRFWPEMHAAYSNMFAGLSEAEYKTLVRLLTRVLRNIRKNEI